MTEPRMRAAVVTCSDAGFRGLRQDTAGDVVAAWLAERFEVAARVLLPDDQDRLEGTLRGLAAVGVRLILTTGGTGLGPRDVTYEAVCRVVTRVIPGVGEALRATGYRQLPQAMLSRQVAGTVGTTLIVALPGAPRACTEGLAVLQPVLPHLLNLAAGRTRHDETPALSANFFAGTPGKRR